MTDDPREILGAAGVECAEVEKVGMSRGWYDPKASHQHALNIIEIDDVAILALARLVAKYKWQRDECADELGRKLAVDYKYDPTTVFAAADVIVDLNRRWDERRK